MSEIKFGFFGAGQIAYSTAKAVNSHPRARVTAVQDLDAGRLQAFSAVEGVTGFHTTAEELLANKDVDAVYIAVPNKFHAPLALQSLEAGKHVLLEKPFAMTLAEAEAVAAAAEKAGKTLMVGMNQRFTEDSQKVRALVRRGLLGDIYHAKAYWIRRAGIPKLGTWFGKRELAGAGSLFDIGVHALDLCLFLMDNFDPVSVSGVSYAKFGPRGLGEGKWGLSDPTETEFDVDDFASALIRFKNGASVDLTVAWACHYPEKNRVGVELFGTEAGASTAPARLFRPDPLREDYDIVDGLRADLEYPHCSRIDNFINHLLEDEPLGVTVEQALAVQRILDGFLESSKSGKEVTF